MNTRTLIASFAPAPWKRLLRRPGFWSSLYVSWLAGFGLVSSAAGAQIILPACFGENMVLQSNATIPIWGWSDQPAGEVEFQGRIVRWKVGDVSKEHAPLRRWDCLFENATTGTGLTMTVRAGKRKGVLWAGELIVETNLTVRSIHVGEVWLWFSKNHPRAPKAELSAAELAGLSKWVHVLKSPLNGATSRGVPPGAAWRGCHPDIVSAEACYFMNNRLKNNLNNLRHVPIGLIEVTRSDWQTNQMPFGLPAGDDWADLKEDSLRNAFKVAIDSASSLFRRTADDHSRTVNELKLQGIVTNAVLLNRDDMNDFQKVRLVTVTNLQPFKVVGTVW